jgi:hypothetical protein
MTTLCLSNDVATFATRKSLSTLPRCSDPGAVPTEALFLFPCLVARKAPRARCSTLRSLALDESIENLRETIAWIKSKRATDEVFARFYAA